MIPDSLYYEAETRRDIVKIFVATWLETIGMIYLWFAGKLYHWAGSHSHCARMEGLAIESDEGLIRYMYLMRMRERNQSAKFN